MSGRKRGQMVLLAAVAIAVALVPMLLAYMQLGYHPDVADPEPRHANDVTSSLERALVEATEGNPASYTWGQREAAAAEVRTRLEPTLETLNRSALARGSIVQVGYNQSLAADWAATACPGGVRRQFGPCEARQGLVLQERAGESHVLAVAVDVRILSQSSRRIVSTVIERD